MKTYIKTAELDLEYRHHYGGNGWAIVEMFPNEYCRVSSFDNKGLSNRAYLAWQKLLKPESVNVAPPNKPQDLQISPLPEAILNELHQLRADLATEKKKVVNTRIVKA